MPYKILNFIFFRSSLYLILFIIYIYKKYLKKEFDTSVGYKIIVKNNLFEISFLVIIIISFFSYLIYKRNKIKGSFSSEKEIIEIIHLENRDLIEYLTSYLVPFIASFLSGDLILGYILGYEFFVYIAYQKNINFYQKIIIGFNYNLYKVKFKEEIEYIEIYTNYTDEELLKIKSSKILVDLRQIRFSENLFEKPVYLIKK